jgi:hypothetical protein
MCLFRIHSRVMLRFLCTIQNRYLNANYEDFVTLTDKNILQEFQETVHCIQTGAQNSPLLRQNSKSFCVRVFNLSFVTGD